MVGVGKQPRSGRWHLASKGGYIHSSLVSGTSWDFADGLVCAFHSALRHKSSVRIQSRVRIVT